MAGVLAAVGEFLGTAGAAEAGAGAIGAGIGIDAGLGLEGLGASAAGGMIGGGEALAGLGGSAVALDASGFLGEGVPSGVPNWDGAGLTSALTSGSLSTAAGYLNPGSILSALGGPRGAFSAASNLYGLSLANKMRKQADPFAKYRGEYGNRLAALEANPSSITSTPGYQAGIQAVQRGSAAGGYTGSGNEIAALAKYGTSFYDQEANRLASLAGAGATPGAGSAPAAQLAGQALAGFGYTQPIYRRPGV